MMADFFTKPLQGTLFRKFRDFIMNVDPLPTQTRLEDQRSVLGNVPEGQADSGCDSMVMAQDLGSGVIGHGREQTWTTVDHEKGKRHRHRILRKKNEGGSEL
jgi:hypothetical protein